MQKVKVHWLDSIQDISGWVDINDYDFDFSRRAESLTVREFIDLSNITAQKINLG